MSPTQRKILVMSSKITLEILVTTSRSEIMIPTTDQNVIKSLIMCFSHVFRCFRQSQWTCRVVVNQFDIYKTTIYFRAQLICGRYYACGPIVFIYSQNNTPTFPNLFYGMRHVNTQCLGCQSRFWNLSQNNLNLKLKTWTWGSGCFDSYFTKDHHYPDDFV